MSSLLQTNYPNLREALTVAEYKRQWFDAKRAELHARGLRDVQIAEQMGMKRAYFSQVVNGMVPSDKFLDRMCAAFGFSFPEPASVPESSNDQLNAAEITSAIRAMGDKLENVVTFVRLAMEKEQDKR